MRDLFPSIQYWIYLLAVLGLSPIAVHFGALWDWTPGAASLAVLTVPTCAAALSGRRATALATGLLAAAGCFAEILQSPAAFTGGFGFVFPLLAGCVMVLVAGGVATVVGHLRQRVDQLEAQKTRYVRELYRRNRDEENRSVESTPQKAEPAGAPDGRSASDGSGVNYPMLLLTLQDIGRRVSTSLDMDRLLPTIISTAKASLKCDACQIYFWNARENSLKRGLPSRQRDAASYVPSPRAGMGRWVLENRQILTRRAVEEDYSLQGLLQEDPEMPDAIAPLAVGGELLGLLVVDGVEEDSPTLVRLLYILADLYALGIKNAQLFERIEDMARRDGLTGLLNHTSFQQELQALLDEASARSSPLTLLMSDIDHFKTFNDTYGHQAGDHVLREVSRLWRSVLPDYAVTARYGGEEFVAALPGDDLSRGRELAETLRESLESHGLDFEGRQLHVTASLGVALWREGEHSPEDLIRQADEALYAAKQDGRNRVVCAQAVRSTEGVVDAGHH